MHQEFLFQITFIKKPVTFLNWLLKIVLITKCNEKNCLKRIILLKKFVYKSQKMVIPPPPPPIKIMVPSPYMIEISQTALAHSSLLVGPYDFKLGTETRFMVLQPIKIWGKLIIISIVMFSMTSYANHQYNIKSANSSSLP